MDETLSDQSSSHVILVEKKRFLASPPVGLILRAEYVVRGNNGDDDGRYDNLNAHI